MPKAATITGDAWLDAEIARCASDPNRFNDVILGRGPYWSRQVEICESVTQYRQTAVKSGNGIGKTYLLAGLALWAFSSHPGCKVVLSAPTLGQLEGAVWGEIETGYNSAAANGMPLGGRLRHLTLEQDAAWRLECYGQGSVAAKSGRHAQYLFAFIDEASGTPREVDEAIDSLNPSCIVRFGNPLSPEGKFFEVCELSGANPHVNVFKVPSLESPHIHLERSPHGMADATWLESMRHEYGEDSIWWLSHILAEFPTEVSEGLLRGEWLTLASQTVHLAAGDRWLGVDLGEGTGGDPSELVVRDDNGVCTDKAGPGHESSNRWSLETTAERAAAMRERFDVEPSHVVYDAGGLGADFDNRLRSVGINGAFGYKGGNAGGGGKFANLRTACHWRLRQRLNPAQQVRGLEGKRKIWVPQKPFSIPAELVSRYRAELTGIKYQLIGDTIALEDKKEFVKRLKKSPNFLDALAMTYALPYL
jgi:hypothetical protein